MRARARSAKVLPGFGIAMGYTLTYLGLMVLLPIAGLVLEASKLSAEQFWITVSSPRALAAYRISFGAAAAAAAINAAMGLLVAWVLVRYRFPGRALLDALVDLPFALPTSVAGITLTALYAGNGLLGRPLAALGLDVAYTALGIVVALTFVGLPFVVRTLQPVLQELDRSVEEAAASLGASRAQSFARVLFPQLLPPLLTGFALAFARGMGEYGSVIFIAGNMPMKTEIAPLLIMTKLEQFEYEAAAAIGVVMLIASFVLLAAINSLQAWTAARRGGGT